MKTTGRRRVAAAAMGLWVALAACSGPDEAGPVDREALMRHLRQGIEHIRVDLRDSAAAELERCAGMAPADPDVLLQRARLKLLVGGDEALVARGWLTEIVTRDPDHVAARRMLYELDRGAGDDAAASPHRDAIERVLGPLGVFDLQLLDAAAGRKPGNPRAAVEAPAGAVPGTREAFEVLQQGLLGLQREGHYAPDVAVPAIEEMLGRFPDLAAIRLLYVRNLLDKQIRITAGTRPGLPALSPRTTSDHAQLHLERVIDTTHPGSALALEAWSRLANVALRLGDWEQSIRLCDVLIQRVGVDPTLRRTALETKGVALYKDRRFAEAVTVLEATLREPLPIPAPYRRLPPAELERFVAWSELPARWILRNAYRDHGQAIPAGSRAFMLRADLEPGALPEEQKFVDIAPRLGIDKLDGLGPSGWADYDQDGDLDLFVTGCDSYGALFRNDGERFTDASVAAGLFEAQSGFSATFADPDNDGWPDIYVGRDGWNGPAKDSLYHNQGDGSFVDVSDRSGLGDLGSTFVHHWLDFDRDGLLDVYLANGITGAGDTNRLFRNRGDGTFADVTGAAGLQESPGTKTIGIAIGDYDDDGYPDIFVSGFQTLNRLYRNRGDGSFEELAAKLGVDGRDHVSTGYVSFFLDYDLDGRLDILRTSLAPWNETLAAMSALWDTTASSIKQQLAVNAPKLYRHLPGGGFEEVAMAAGLVHPVGVMGANVADVDNDGYTDLYLGTGDPKIERLEPDRFYLNRQGKFSDQTFAYGLGHLGKGHGVSIVDWNRDGRVEIYAQEGGFEHGDQWNNAFYLNRLEAGNWLQLRLSGRASNRDAIGAKVVARLNGRTVTREVHGGHGFGSSDMPALAFGLGAETRVVELEVRWPAGGKQVFRDVAANRRLHLVEGGELAEER